MSTTVTYPKLEDSIPSALTNTQGWFANVITHPLDENGHISRVSPHGTLIAEEASRYIVPTSKLKPYQRIEVYNQQYWWRLLNAMQENFPLVTRLFGYRAFNETISIPYLIKYPSHHWSLSIIGENLPKWIAKSYKEPDKLLIENAVNLDWAFTVTALAPQKDPLATHQMLALHPENLFSHTFYLQPYINLFKWDHDLLTFREDFLKQDVEYWTENDFPPLAKERTYHFILYRTGKNTVHSQEISEAEYFLLKILQEGSSIDAACEQLEQNEAVYAEAAQHLQTWVHSWVSRGWLTLERCPQLIS